MRLRVTLTDPLGSHRDVQITAPPGARLGDLRDRLAEFGLPATSRLWSGRRQLSDDQPLGAPGLAQGQILCAWPQEHVDGAAGAPQRLEVVGGPDAGLSVPVAVRTITIGRGEDCELRLTDPNISHRHASVTASASGIKLLDLGSTNGTTVDSTPVRGSGHQLRHGQFVRLGESVLTVSASAEPALATAAAADGTRRVSRPPRLRSASPDLEVEFPLRPTRRLNHYVRHLTALAPALGGVVIALVMHEPQFLAFAILSPLVLILGGAFDGIQSRRSRRRRKLDLDQHERAAQALLATRRAAERTMLRRAHPDPAALRRTVSVPDCRLWERRRTDSDHLELRLGLTSLPSAVVAHRGGRREAAAPLRDVPAVINLGQGGFGLAGPAGPRTAIARWLLGQLAALHSPADVELGVLPRDSSWPEWNWTRWLPHLGRHIPAGAPSRETIVRGLLQLIRDRLSRQTSPVAQPWTGRWLVLLFDGVGELGSFEGLSQLVTDGPRVGITSIWLDEEVRQLPNGCTFVAQVCGETGSRVRLEAAGQRHRDHAGRDRPAPPAWVEALADQTTRDWADELARSLAALSDSSPEAASSLPSSCRLLDVLGIPEPVPTDLIERWRDSIGRPPTAIIGASRTGPYAIDLIADGPHVLIAGTTGAGKSELLQTLIAALAVHSCPRSLSFVLIDYKGGAGLAECARLPQTVGIVTDLDPHLTRRALRSFDAELRYREKLLAAANVKDIAAYQSSSAQSRIPLARLVLVVDEFAALAEELPDFVSGLIGITQRGRSLGLHLVLATQRPGGVVSPEIRANCALRISLRVADPGDSCDVIGSAVASSIDKSQPGRAFVRSGAKLIEIQTATTGTLSERGISPIAVCELDEWGRERRRSAIASEGEGGTDLAVLVDALRDAAELSGTPPPRRPWLAALPAQLSLDAIEDGGKPHLIPWGLVDLPDVQRQDPLRLDLASESSVLLVGSARSGRTQALRTLALAAAARIAPDELHIHAVEAARGGLSGLAELPHHGSIIDREHPAAVERLLVRLADEASRRRSIFAERGFTSISDAHHAGLDMPWLLLLIDGLESVLAATDAHDGGAVTDLLTSLIRTSSMTGLTIAISGDRSALTTGPATGITAKFVLRLTDRADFGLASIPTRDVPEFMPPGRAIRIADRRELQFAVPGPGLLAAMPRVHRARTQSPIRVRPLPRLVKLADLAPTTTSHPAIGVGGDDARTIRLALFERDSRWLVAGPSRSGRTSFLRCLLAQVHGHSIDVLVAAPRHSPLTATAVERGIPVVHPDSVRLPEATSRRRLVLVDDSEEFLDTAAGELLHAITTSEHAGNTGRTSIVVVARSDVLLSYRGLGASIRPSRRGVLLRPGPGDGNLLDIHLPLRRAPEITGRGILVGERAHLSEQHDGPEPITIQLAMP